MEDSQLNSLLIRDAGTNAPDLKWKPSRQDELHTDATSTEVSEMQR